ncbi:phage tail protein [Kitasatospora sp. NPDC058965]|uniref:phage tail protein n=1 Tax=Kitasatospora sp. NPDC058965 TaxID=3346682 RepID=UPI003691E7F4
MTSPLPNGTIVPYAGQLDPTWLQGQGWLYCDGSELQVDDYQGLYAAIGDNYGGGPGTFNLPDLRGRFARGVDQGAGRDPYANSRTASNQGGLAGNNPGSVQAYCTAQPTAVYTTDSPGDHTHSVEHLPTDQEGLATAGSHYAIWPSASATSIGNGDHSHNVTGGDAETRPINKYVYFLIKYEG